MNYKPHKNLLWFKNNIIIFNICLAFLATGCTKWVEVDTPKTRIMGSTVFESDYSATSAILGIYSDMMTGSNFASGGGESVTLLAGLSADELSDYTGSAERAAFFTNSLTPINSTVKNCIWQPAYKYIYNCNLAIEGLEASTTLSSSVKKQLIGEAKFIRAFCYFYLVNFYGDVPLILTSDYRLNLNAERSVAADIYEQIVEDLLDCNDLLADDFSFSEGNRIRPNKMTAEALLARTYLYNNQWSEAETEASMIINNPSYSLLTELNDVFLANSAEAIWQLLPVLPGRNTNEGGVFIPYDYPSYATLSGSILGDFEQGDQRREKWIDSVTNSETHVTYYFPFKYKVQGFSNEPLTEYSMVFRLAEQFLIRAEAKAQQNNLIEAMQDLDVIRNRAGLPLIQDTNPAITKNDLLLAIEKERKAEFFAEWGHRWLDLKRTNRANAILSSIKLDNWQPMDVLYPIPQSEITNNPRLTQNEGYN